MSLILSRRIDETIEVDGPASFRIVAVNGGKVRVAVDAERSVTIDRGEVAARKALDFSTELQIPAADAADA